MCKNNEPDHYVFNEDADRLEGRNSDGSSYTGSVSDVEEDVLFPTMNAAKHYKLTTNLLAGNPELKPLEGVTLVKKKK